MNTHSQLSLVLGLLSCITFAPSVFAGWSVGKLAIEEKKESTLKQGFEELFEEKKAKKAISDINQPRGFEKKMSQLTEEEQAIIDYSQALEWMNQGMEVKATHLLHQGLNRFPECVPIRLELVKLYLKKNKDTEAETLLLEGLSLFDNHPEFLGLMAVVREKKEDYEGALQYLSKIPAHQKNEKNMVALMGHVYQRTGNFSLARQQYNRLLKVEPNNALWLLGLAMALDAEGNPSGALAEYKKLQSNPTIEVSLLDYVEERISILKGRKL